MGFRRFFGLGKKTEKISDGLIKELGFEDKVVRIIKQVAPAGLQPLNISNLENDLVETVGISFSISEEKSEEVVLKLQSQFHQTGYLVFINERNFNFNSECRIGIIKGSDQFDILKVVQTNGENYDISNQEVISRLMQWNNRYPFTIVGADYDWVEAIFIEEIQNNEIESFAHEMYEFCPDIVDQGTESIDGLIEELKNTNKLFLWWD
ncbi:uncharacterized protein DUF4253 [Planomicrobium soli]|uniref:Uncharacterized protein DUF4253 n=1 Tax=Planomicrobium soli TaxID=1176648 RepID=A0A2P8H4A1_9BACL|nr:DUF4253 domain-containing protein [Planomicrobium soli]PSL41042.1 uncharacterized protein DUF4253 [Planomicrobium soli]